MPSEHFAILQPLLELRRLSVHFYTNNALLPNLLNAHLAQLQKLTHLFLHYDDESVKPHAFSRVIKYLNKPSVEELANHDRNTKRGL